MGRRKRGYNLRFLGLVTQYLTSYLPDVRKVSPSTREAYKDSLTLFLRWISEARGIKFGDIGEQEFTQENIEGFLNHLMAQNKSVKTANLRLTAIKLFASFCFEEEPSFECMAVEAAKVKPVQEIAEKTVVYPTLKQIKLLFSLPDAETAKGCRDLTFLCLLFFAGLKAGEIQKLTLSDLIKDEDGCYLIVVRGRGGKERMVLLREDSALVLSFYLRRFHRNSELDCPLFYVNRRTGKEPVSRGVGHKIIDKYILLAHKKDKTFPQDLRSEILRQTMSHHVFKEPGSYGDVKDILGSSYTLEALMYGTCQGRKKRGSLLKEPLKAKALERGQMAEDEYRAQMAALGLDD